MKDSLSSDLASLRIDRGEPPSRSGWLRGLVIVAVVVAAGGAAWIYGAPYVESRVFKTEVELTKIVSVSPAEADAKFTSSGYVVPQKVSKVGTQLTARLAAVLIEEGDTVVAGQVVAELEGADQRARLRAARAQVVAAQARVDTRRAELNEVMRQAERERSLAKKGASNTATAEDLEARVQVFDQQVKAAQAEVRAATADADAIAVNIEYLTIKSPISGRVLSKPATVGELAGLQAAVVAELADFSTLLVETDVPEGRLHMIEHEGPCEIVLDAYPTERRKGKVHSVSPKINRSKATATVKVAFVTLDERILPDMSARVNFLQQELDDVALKQPARIIVPAVAIAERQGAQVVFVYDEGVVRMRPISLGEKVGTGFHLLQGPAAGTSIVREPAPLLVDGQPVKIKDS